MIDGNKDADPKLQKFMTIGDLVSKDTMCCVGGEMKHLIISKLLFNHKVQQGCARVSKVVPRFFQVCTKGYQTIGGLVSKELCAVSIGGKVKY